MMKQVKSLEGRMQAIEKQRDEIRNEIFKIESAGNFIEMWCNVFDYSLAFSIVPALSRFYVFSDAHDLRHDG